MVSNFIYIKRKRYNYYDTYKTYKKAKEIGDYLKRRTNSRYFILISEGGFFSPTKKYNLYTTRVIRIGF